MRTVTCQTASNGGRLGLPHRREDRNHKFYANNGGSLWQGGLSAAAARDRWKPRANPSPGRRPTSRKSNAQVVVLFKL